MKRLIQAAPEIAPAVQSMARQMLHCWRIRITHPIGGERMTVKAPMPRT